MGLAQSVRQWVLRGAYNTAFCLMTPFILYRLHSAGSSGQEGFAGRWREHLGWVEPVAGHPLWLHAASVGEVLVARPLIQALKQRYPQLAIVLTTTTRTGAAEAAKLADMASHRYAPLDCPWMVKRFLSRIRPAVCCVMETERWLNYPLACERQGIPLVVANARLSPRSFRRYRRFPALFRLWAQPVRQLWVQYAEDAQRLTALGVPAQKMLLTGSIKFDITFDPAVVQHGQALRNAWGGRPVWVAASTHAGEEEQVLQAHREVLNHLPEALLVLVPRHPQRFDTVVALCLREGFTVMRRTSATPLNPATTVYLADTMGELPLLLAAGDLAFVGGSLVAVGGHNLLEPAALGKPCLTGPHHFNFQDITRQLLDSGAAQLVADAQELGRAVSSLLQDGNTRQRRGEAGKRVVEANQGALQRTLQALVPLLPVAAC